VFAPNSWPQAGAARIYGPETPFTPEWGKEPLRLSSGITVFSGAAGDKGAVVELTTEVFASRKGRAETPEAKPVKTTVELPEELWRKAKIRAYLSGALGGTLGLMASAMRHGVGADRWGAWVARSMTCRRL